MRGLFVSTIVKKQYNDPFLFECSLQGSVFCTSIGKCLFEMFFYLGNFKECVGQCTFEKIHRENENCLLIIVKQYESIV